MSELLTPDVVDAVRRHMNDDHATDALRIVRALAPLPRATSAEVIDVTTAGLVLTAVEDDGTARQCTIAWPHDLPDRAAIRHAVVALHDQACELLGLDPADLA